MKEGLNLQCPYKVSVDTETSVYSFTTKNKIEYNIVFDEISPFGGTTTGVNFDKVYNIVLEKITSTKEPFDKNTSITICKILEEFFKDRDNILFYICDSSDNKQIKRSKIFKKWEKSFFKGLSVEHLQREFGNTDITTKGTQYSGIIYHTENENSEAIVINYNDLIDYWNNTE